MAQLDIKKYNIGNHNSMFTFAEYPSIKIYENPTGGKWKNHLLFGDYIKLLDTNIVSGRVRAKSRNTSGWVKVGEIRKNRVLEINFIDIGQGDGCHVVTSDDKHIIIDAGKTDNMVRYLSWRFNLYRRKTPLPFPFTIVISHSDLDHYLGFSQVFENDKIWVDRIYHNGLVERPGTKPLGEVKDGHIIELVQTTADMKDIIEKESNRKGTRSTYCKTLFKSLTNSPEIEFLSLSKNDRFMEGYDENNKTHRRENSIKILGPITKKIDGKDALKTINDLGKDKNGHSVILKLLYGKAKILLGGDVNTEFGKLIFEHYKKEGELADLQVDVAKACHHGSSHFHYNFIKSLYAAATVISSGDDENYGHPRPDTIGALGKLGYGDKPLIFSTELARSNKEITLSKLEVVSKQLQKLKEVREALKTETDPDEITRLKAIRNSANSKINSFLTRFGMINLRTDGSRMIVAQKYETPASHGKWDIHKLKYSYYSKRFNSRDE